MKLLSLLLSVFGNWCVQSHPWLMCLDLAPLTFFRGEGLGVRGFALCLDWIFDREFNTAPRFKSMNKALHRRLASQGSTPHPRTAAHS